MKAETEKAGDAAEGDGARRNEARSDFPFSSKYVALLALELK
jgi:hypothetical protein